MKYFIQLLFLFGLYTSCAGAGRTFVHPGIAESAADIARARAKIAARAHPWTDCFNALRTCWSADPFQKVRPAPKALLSSQCNSHIGQAGRRAHDLALMYRLTDDSRYAIKAIEFLNAHSHYTALRDVGTGPLDFGKIYLLVTAAELLRDSPLWSPPDRTRFANMLRTTFLPRIQNGDPCRFGNQGLFALRGTLAIAIFLDDEPLYTRTWNYLNNLPQRGQTPSTGGPARGQTPSTGVPARGQTLSTGVPARGQTLSTGVPARGQTPGIGGLSPSISGGLSPFPSGPPICDAQPCASNEFQITYKLIRLDAKIANYGYDEQLCHYIYPNGQSQEASRDQPHALVGLGLYVDLAEAFYLQGDDLYGALDNRILLGLEWSLRYNLTDWELAGVTTQASTATFANGLFYQVRHRSGRWKSLRPTPQGRGTIGGPGFPRECALAHYRDVCHLPSDRYQFLARAVRQGNAQNGGFESWGAAPNWYYEWTGWGTLMKRR